MHNFWLPLEQYRKIFQQGYLDFKIPLPPKMNRTMNVASEVAHIARDMRIFARPRVDVWKNKNYVDTVQDNIKILDDYLTLCEEKNVRPIMFLPPRCEGYMKHFNRRILDEFYYLVQEAARKHSTALFVDGWQIPQISDADFSDDIHMNLQGAAKFSAIMNNAIEQLERMS